MFLSSTMVFNMYKQYCNQVEALLKFFTPILSVKAKLCMKNKISHSESPGH